MAIKGFRLFPQGYRLLDGSKFNNLFGGNSASPGVPLEQVYGFSIQKFLGLSLGSALTAVGTNRATALKIGAQVNNITTAAASTGAVLPLGTLIAAQSAPITIFNAGANAITVYAAGSDTIDGTAGATGVTLTNGNRCAFYPVAVSGAGVTSWVSAQLGAVSS